MALIKASYTVERGMAYAGQVSDTSNYNIDGATVAVDGDIGCGRLVAVKDVEPIEGHKLVTLADGKLPVLGITIMSHAYSPEGFYEQDIAVNVMTHGRVWAVADKALTAADVKYDTFASFDATGKVAKGGAVKTGYKFTGQILDAGSEYKIVEIQVLQSAVIPAAASGE